MKKLFIILLAVLMLAGCSGANQNVDTPNKTVPPDNSDSVQVQTTPIYYTTTKKIENSMPDFKFEIFGENINDRSNIYNNCNSITSVDISDEKGNYKQTIQTSTNIPSECDKPYGFSLDDWDFDGYLDISLWEVPGGSMGNRPCIYWLWDKEKKLFIENDDLFEISKYAWLSANPATKQIEAQWIYDAYEYRIAYYKYEGGKYVFLKTKVLKRNLE